MTMNIEKANFECRYYLINSLRINQKYKLLQFYYNKKRFSVAVPVLTAQ